MVERDISENIRITFLKGACKLAIGLQSMQLGCIFRIFSSLYSEWNYQNQEDIFESVCLCLMFLESQPFCFL